MKSRNVKRTNMTSKSSHAGRNGKIYHAKGLFDHGNKASEGIHQEVLEAATQSGKIKCQKLKNMKGMPPQVSSSIDPIL